VPARTLEPQLMRASVGVNIRHPIDVPPASAEHTCCSTCRLVALPRRAERAWQHIPGARGRCLCAGLREDGSFAGDLARLMDGPDLTLYRRATAPCANQLLPVVAAQDRLAVVLRHTARWC